MQHERCLLYLNDPLGERKCNTKGLVFHENESFLSQAQTALWQARQGSRWICVAGEGHAAYIALALAAQLPVDRLALINMPLGREKLPREINRIRTFARRNLALVASEILLIGGSDRLMQIIRRGTLGCRLCALKDFSGEELLASWEEICGKKHLRRPACVFSPLPFA